MTTMTYDVYFYEAFEEEQKALRKHLHPNLHAGFTAAAIQEHQSARPPAPLISTRTQSVIPTAWAPYLSGILTRSTGFDHITRYLNTVEGSLCCGYLPLYCNRAVAEQAMLLWTALLRKLPRQMAQFSKFHRDGLTGRECAGKVLLVVGVGNIGLEVIRIGTGLGMEALGVDVHRRHQEVTYVGIEPGLARAHVIVCAMDLTAGNHYYFDEKRLRTARSGAVFVNVARGELADTCALLRLLESGHLAAVGLDVHDMEAELAIALRHSQAVTQETALAALELARRPDVICTPHNAFNTLEAVDRKAAQSNQQLEYFREHGRFLWPIPRDHPE